MNTHTQLAAVIRRAVLQVNHYCLDQGLFFTVFFTIASPSKALQSMELLKAVASTKVDEQTNVAAGVASKTVDKSEKNQKKICAVALVSSRR